jgi:hypothetical protein
MTVIRMQAAFKPGRFFHVMGQGWFVCAREGIKGPFFTRQRAENYLKALVETSPDTREQGSEFAVS